MARPRAIDSGGAFAAAGGERGRQTSSGFTQAGSSAAGAAGDAEISAALGWYAAAASAMAVAADWLLRPGDEDAQTVGRTAEVLAPRDGALRSARLLVLGRGGAWRVSAVTDDGPVEPEATDVESLARQLAILTGGEGR